MRICKVVTAINGDAGCGVVGLRVISAEFGDAVVLGPNGAQVGQMDVIDPSHDHKDQDEDGGADAEPKSESVRARNEILVRQAIDVVQSKGADEEADVKAQHRQTDHRSPERFDHHLLWVQTLLQIDSVRYCICQARIAHEKNARNDCHCAFHSSDGRVLHIGYKKQRKG